MNDILKLINMDDFLYNETISNDSSPAKYMTDKQVLMCLDQNGGSSGETAVFIKVTV